MPDPPDDGVSVRRGRQPVHVVYGGAHLFRADVARQLGTAAIRMLESNGTTAEVLAAGVVPPAVGLRIRPLGRDLPHRALRTLDLFMASLVETSAGRIPERLALTLPKVTELEQVERLVDRLEPLEGVHGLIAPRALVPSNPPGPQGSGPRRYR